MFFTYLFIYIKLWLSHFLVVMITWSFFVAHLDRFVGCVQAFGREDPSSAVGSFSIPPPIWICWAEEEEEGQTECVCVVCPVVSLLVYVWLCVVCVSVQVIDCRWHLRRRIESFPFIAPFSLTFFSSPLISRVRFFGTDRIFWDLKNPFSVTLCCEILGNKWLKKTSPISFPFELSRRLTSWC